tara:strand:+ start:936 stop:1298 length:363 start_codon:yes stop_codon:yes gene_type:complete
MKTLTLYTGYGDQINTFGVRVKAPNVKTARNADGEMITFDLSVKKVSLYQGYDTKDDGIFWGLASGATLKSSYSQADKDEQKRLREDAPVEDGDIVLIEGNQYRAKVLGDYSNCVVFEAV